MSMISRFIDNKSQTRCIDVALYFTREQWELLSQPEKQLYRDQMLKNYQALISLGYSGSTPDLIYRIELGEAELWIWDALPVLTRVEELLLSSCLQHSC
uniref:KRAB domain-containing protein n=1 Tax=Chelonoidis abingdonii TaxID=106734 RepID=A0A8C0G377_CHEAB